MKFGNEFWLILFWEYIIPKLFAVHPANPAPYMPLSLSLFLLCGRYIQYTKYLFEPKMYVSHLCLAKKTNYKRPAPYFHMFADFFQYSWRIFCL